MKRAGKFYVYIVECKDGTYYTGYTNDIEKRIEEHNYSKRGPKYLRGRLPVKLAYVKEYSYYKRAVAGERSIKRLTHKQKEELIRIYERNKWQPKVFVKTFGWPFVSVLQCLVFVL